MSLIENWIVTNNYSLNLPISDIITPYIVKVGETVDLLAIGNNTAESLGSSSVLRNYSNQLIHSGPNIGLYYLSSDYIHTHDEFSELDHAHAGLDVLTGGPASDADGLHTHSNIMTVDEINELIEDASEEGILLDDYVRKDGSIKQLSDITSTGYVIEVAVGKAHDEIHTILAHDDDEAPYTIDNLKKLMDGRSADLLHIHSVDSHNSLTGIQGGTANEYYHFAQSQHNILTDQKNADSLHLHSHNNLEDLQTVNPSVMEYYHISEQEAINLSNDAFLFRDGHLPMTGNLDMDGNDIIDTGTVTINEDLRLNTNVGKFYIGGSQDASIYFDGTDLNINITNPSVGGTINLNANLDMNNNNIIDVGNITGTDVDISAGTGDYTSTGNVNAGKLFATAVESGVPPVSIGWDTGLGFKALDDFIASSESVGICVNDITLQSWSRNNAGTVTNIVITSDVDNFNIFSDTSISESLIVTGDVSCAELAVETSITITDGTDFKIFRRGDAIVFQNQVNNEPTALELFANLGDGGDNVTVEFWGYGTPTQTTNRHRAGFGWQNSTDSYWMWTDNAGSQSAKDWEIFAGGTVNRGMFNICGTSGSVSIEIGMDNVPLKFGLGRDASIYWNTANLIIDPDLLTPGTRLLIGATGDDDMLLNDIEIDGALNHDGFTVGFYGTTPIAQAVLATGAGATVDNIITALQNLGLVKQA